jgi:hypothetical protein
VIVAGDVFGLLTVLEPLAGRPAKCRCRCRCGVEKLVRASSLRAGSSLSCGCARGALLSASRAAARTTCRTCGQPKPPTEAHSCPECVSKNKSARAKRYREKHADRVRAYEKQRASLPAVRERKRELEAEARRRLPEEYILSQLKQRCRNPKHQSFDDYGGRGIVVDAAFDGPGGLARFLAEVGRRPSDAHMIERKDNERGYVLGNLKWATLHEQQRNKRSNRLITFRGETMCLVDWGTRTGIAHELIRARIDRLGWTVEAALTTPPRKRAA